MIYYNKRKVSMGYGGFEKKRKLGSKGHVGKRRTVGPLH